MKTKSLNLRKPENGPQYYGSPRISSEVMDCSMPLTFDHYNFCSMKCRYCFAYFFKSNNPAITDLSLRSINADAMIRTISGDPVGARNKKIWEHFYSKKFLLHWGGLADPFCGFESKRHVGLPLLKALGENNYPTLFSFKGATLMEDDYLKLFSKYSRQKNFAFQVSMVTLSDEVGAYIEVGVPAPSYRIKMIKTLSDMGYWTILRLRPFIMGVTDETLDELLDAALKAGIQGVSMEFFAVDSRANEGMKDRYEWLAKAMGLGNVKSFMKYFRDLSPPERGGYRRLNRYVKEEAVKKVFTFCQKHKLVFACSDPDFKELNMSGSCCGMPDKYPPNRLLENWSRDQLTYHLKEARLLYHRIGERKLLTFGEVYSTRASYLDDIHFGNDHVAVTGMTEAERVIGTYRNIMQAHWNNLRSPASPQNYFHNKLVPVDYDEDGNIVYTYEPMEYEIRWAREGIDLAKR